MERSNVTRTAKREYFTTCARGLWSANFQPLNPKTGELWQASRSIKAGHDVYQLSNWKDGSVSGLISGSIPSDWNTSPWNGVGAGFSTEQLALAAIKLEKIKEMK